MTTLELRKFINLVESVETRQLNENFGLDYFIDRLADACNDPIKVVYANKEEILQKFIDSKHSYTPLKSINLAAAGPGAKWIRSQYELVVQETLYNIVKFHPRFTEEIKQFLKDYNGEKVPFRHVEEQLLPALSRYAEKIKNGFLIRVLSQWNDMINEYARIEQRHSAENERNFGGVTKLDKKVNGVSLGQITDRSEFAKNSKNDDTTYYTSLGQGYGSDSSGEIDPLRAADNDRKQLSGKQNSAAEDMVNAILGSLPSRIAGDIRNAIARSPNKLQALQREMAARGIK